MRAFLYARVSTRDKGQEVENQLRELREFILRQGWTLIQEFVDHESGKSSDREQFQAMLTACSQKKADVIVFWALDRFTREGAYEALRDLNLLTSYGVAFRSYSEQYLDTCGLFKEAIIAILATLAKQERIRLGERVRAGLKTAAELLEKTGKTKHGKTRWAGRPKHGVPASRMRSLRAQGFSYRAIAANVGISEGSVRIALKSRRKRNA